MRPLSADVSNSVLRITREVELRKGPSNESESLGVLPAKTVAEDRNAKVGPFQRVAVELESGENIEGWVPSDALKPAKRAKIRKPTSDPAPPVPAEPVNVPPSNSARKSEKILLPEDEVMVIRRQPSFIYGIQGGINLGIIQTEVSSATYFGVGFVGGGFVGFFLDRDFPIRFEINITQVNATAPLTTGTANLGFNFFEVGVIPAYRFDKFEVFGGLTYSYGIGIGYVPTSITLTNGASDLSSLGLEAGAGYRVPLSPDNCLVFRTRYLINFLRSPFALQSIGLVVALEFQG